jgi:hypothetical protein
VASGFLLPEALLGQGLNYVFNQLDIDPNILALAAASLGAESSGLGASAEAGALPANVLQSFNGVEDTTFLNPQTLYRLEGADGSFQFGSYYGFSAPTSAAEGDAMYNISAFSPNPMTTLTTYQAPAGMTVPVGPVNGGTAYQAYIPGGQGLTLIGTNPGYSLITPP